MFPVGNKVAVIASATKSKGARIRKGSLGYVANVGRVFNLGKNNRYPHVSMRVVPARIVFTRFGYENKIRSELKFAALIFPATDPKYVKSPETHLNRLVAKAADYHTNLKEMFQSEGSRIKKVTPIAITAVNSTQSVTENEIEFLAWFRSIAMSSVLNEILFAAPNDPKRKALVDLTGGDKLNQALLMSSLGNRKHAESFVKSLFKNKEEVYKWTSRLQQVLQLNRMQRVNKLGEKYQRPMLTSSHRFSNVWELKSTGLEDLMHLIPTRMSSHRAEDTLANGWLQVYNRMAQTLI